MHIEVSKELQQTVKKDIVFQGVGIHSGRPVNMTLKPAPGNHGIKFVRTDICNNNYIQVTPENIATVSGGMCTTLKNNGNICIKTPEHLLAAMWGAKIDNAIIEIDAEEVPIMDGSAIVFYDEIMKAGLLEQTEYYRHYLVIDNSFKIDYQDTNIKASPCKNFTATASIAFSNDNGKPLFKCMSSFDDKNDDFTEKLADAHTFALKSWEKYKKLAVAGIGADASNTIVVEDMDAKNFAKIVNPNILRRDTYQEECADHKLLDFVGDLMLLGIHVKGKFQLDKPGHFINSLFVKHLFQEIKKLPKAVFQLKTFENIHAQI